MKQLQLMVVQLVIAIHMLSCSTDDLGGANEEPVVLADEIEIYEESKLENNSLVLAIENAGKAAYLLTKQGQRAYEWEFNANLGNDLELLPNGKLLGMFKVEDPQFSFGGYGGIIKIMDTNAEEEWEYNYSSEDFLAHHDAEMLPNGNVLFLVWERTSVSEAQALGINAHFDTFTEALIEVNPVSNEIVWEWHSLDHLVQDVDSNLPNFGIINENPQLIDHNYNILVDEYGGDIMHANGIDYDEDNDLIFVSVNFYGEVWVIDHSTTSTEAGTHTGGNYGKGGDLIYRFGNPEAYNHDYGTQLFHKVHFPNLLENNVPGQGNMLVFVNGSEQQSTVYELRLPETYELKLDQSNEPEVVWSFSHPELYAAIISGAVRLENGNTLICEGDFGFWEVTQDKEVVWKYNGGGEQRYWRAYNYKLDDPALTQLGL